ncbi:unnamed protein product [Fructobacillus cardui]|uniref:hypothetical protein n=1 Tax=Fructobacillus cardui TaxID=2893170 RepID=UPI002DADA5FC|nr:unnamed protein product [Fructobacillus cardui]
MKKTGLTKAWHILKKLVSYWWKWAQRCCFVVVLIMFWGSTHSVTIAKKQGAHILPAEQLVNVYTLFSWMLLGALLGLPLVIAMIEVLAELLTNRKSKNIK